MDLNAYATEKIAAVRLADLRAACARAALIHAARVERRSVGSALGEVLIQMGRWLADRPMAGSSGRGRGVECRGAGDALR